MFQRTFLHVIMDKSAEGGLEGRGNTMTVRKYSQENRNQSQKFPLNLKSFFMQPGPGVYVSVIYSFSLAEDSL